MDRNAKGWGWGVVFFGKGWFMREELLYTEMICTRFPNASASLTTTTSSGGQLNASRRRPTAAK